MSNKKWTIAQNVYFFLARLYKCFEFEDKTLDHICWKPCFWFFTSWLVCYAIDSLLDFAWDILFWIVWDLSLITQSDTPFVLLIKICLLISSFVLRNFLSLWSLSLHSPIISSLNHSFRRGLCLTKCVFKGACFFRTLRKWLFKRKTNVSILSDL